MILLLDTNALYWWLNEPGRLSPSAAGSISSKSNSIIVSSVVPWELAIKTNIGRIDSRPLLTIWGTKLAGEGFAELPIDASHAIRAGLLPRIHKDFFDRMLAAQAQATGWPIISADPIFDSYGVRRIW